MAYTRKAQKPQTVNFDSAILDVMSKMMDGDELSRWRLKVSVAKTLPQLLSLYPLSSMTYDRPFSYRRRDLQGRPMAAMTDLRGEISSALGYMASLHSVYKDLKHEAEMNALEKIALDRITATERTKDRRDMANSGRTGDDDELDDGSNAGLLGYVEGDISGVTPQMKELMAEVEQTFRLLSGMDIDEAEKLIGEGRFDISRSGLHAVSDNVTYTAKDLSDIVSCLVRLRESLPYLDEEFAGRRLARDTNLRTHLSAITTLLKGRLRTNPYYTATELVNAIAGPKSMEALEGGDDGAAISKILGSISDPSEADRLVAGVGNALTKTPVVHVNRYEGGQNDIAGFFSESGYAYNVAGRKSRDLKAKAGEVLSLKARFDSIADPGSPEAREAFEKGRKAAIALQKDILFSGMNGFQKIVYSEKTSPAIVEKVNDFLASTYGYMKEGPAGLHVCSETLEYLSQAAGTFSRNVAMMASRIGMERGTDYMQEIPTAAEFSAYVARMEGRAYRTDLEDDRSYLDVFDDYYRLYRRSVESQNTQIEAARTLISPKEGAIASLKDGAAAKVLAERGLGLSADDITLSIDDRKLIGAGVSFRGIKDAPSPLNDALMLYHEGERRVRMLGQLDERDGQDRMSMPGMDPLGRMRREALEDRDSRLDTLLDMLSGGHGTRSVEDVRAGYLDAIEVSLPGKLVDEDLADDLRMAIASDLAGTYGRLRDEIGAYHSLTDDIVANATTLRERNVDHLAAEYRQIADAQGVEVSDKDLRDTVSAAVDAIWNGRKTASAASRAVETFNQYAIRGLFDEKREKTGGAAEESLSAFRSGAATFVSMKDVSTFVLETMPKRVEGLQKLYNANVGAHALSPEEDRRFHDAHAQLIEERIDALNREMTGIRGTLARDEALLDSGFSADVQYNLGTALRGIIESGDIDDLRGIDGRLEERRALKAEVVKAYEDMRDTLRAMMTDSPVRDPVTGEARPGDHPDLTNSIFPVDEIAKFLIKGQLEREEPGSYTYASRDMDWRFFNRLVDAAREQVRASAERWDGDGSFINPDDYTPRCITTYLEARSRYDALLSQIGTDARFEEFRTKSLEFVRNNPVDPYSRAVTSYLNAVRKGAQEDVTAQLYGEVVRTSADAHCMGGEAKLLYASNPDATRVDITATGTEFMSDRNALYGRVRAERAELSRREDEVRFLSSAAEPLFVIAGAAVPDYSREMDMVRDDIASASLIQNIAPAMRESTEAARRGISRLLDMDWKDYRREMGAYHQALVSRLSGQKLDTQLDMLASSLLAGPVGQAKVVRTGLDKDGYWHAELDTGDPVFADSFDTIRKHIISVNDGIGRNGNMPTEAYRKMTAAARREADGLLKVRNDIITAYAATVEMVGGALGKDQLNELFRASHPAYLDYINDLSERFSGSWRPLGQYFRTDEDGKTTYVDRAAFRRMVASDERFREGAGLIRGGLVSVGRFIELSALPRTITSPVRTPLLVKNLGTGAESDISASGPDAGKAYSPDAVIMGRGSAFYGINTKNMSKASGPQNYCGLLFRTYGKGGIDKEAVLTMLAVKAAEAGADRLEATRAHYESLLDSAKSTERKDRLMADMSRTMKYDRRDAEQVLADLDPQKWDVVEVPGVSDGVSGLVMLVPNSGLGGFATASFIRNNPLYVKEGRIDVRSGISPEGIDRIRDIISRRMMAAERAEQSGRLAGLDATQVQAAIGSYRKQLDALAGLEALGHGGDGHAFLTDKASIDRLITGEVDGRSSEFVAAFTDVTRDNAIQKALDARDQEYDTELSALKRENEILEGGVPGRSFNPLEAYGDASRKPEGRPADTDGAVEVGNVFLSEGGLNQTRVSGERAVDDMTHLTLEIAMRDLAPIRAWSPKETTGVKRIFDAAFRPIDGKGTPLYRDPEKFGFLLSFIRDNLRSDKPLSFCMTGGTLLDESFVAMADRMNLYEAIANGEGENEVTYLVYRKMFEAANVEVTLNSRDIVQLEGDGEDGRTDDAVDMAERERSGSRMDGGEAVQQSIALEHFAALEPELNEYGMSQERDNVQRTFAYQAELRRSLPDTSSKSVYGQLGIRGVNHFFEFFGLMWKHLEGKADLDDQARLAELMPKHVLALGDATPDVTVDDVRSWFRAWEKGDEEGLDNLHPDDISVERKLLVVRSLLPLAGADQIRPDTLDDPEGPVMSKVRDILDANPTTRGVEVTRDILLDFYDNTSCTARDRHGLPDLRSAELDRTGLGDEARHALGLATPEQTRQLYRLLATAGMEEDVIPSNMDSVVELLGVDEERPLSLRQYSQFFKEAFGDVLEDFSNAKAFTDLFDKVENIERLQAGMKRFMDPDTRRSPTELKQEAVKLVAEIAQVDIGKDIHLDIVPMQDETTRELADRITRKLDEELSTKGIPEGGSQSAEVGALIADAFTHDSMRLADALLEYAAGQKAAADRNGGQMVMKVSGLASRIGKAMGPSMLPRWAFTDKELIGKLVKALGQAVGNGLCDLSGSSTDRDGAIRTVKAVLGQEGYLDMALDSCRSRLVAKVPAVAAAMKVDGERWAETFMRVAKETGEGKCIAFVNSMSRAGVTPASMLFETFSLKEDLADQIDHYQRITACAHGYHVDPMLVTDMNQIVKDVISNARAAEPDARADQLLVPYALFPTEGHVDRSGVYELKFDRYAPVYSRARAEEIHEILRRYPDSESLSVVEVEMSRSEAAIRDRLAKADSPEALRAAVKEIVGDKEMERRAAGIRFFSGLSASAIQLLPADAVLIPKTFDGGRIAPGYAARIHEDSERRKEARKLREETSSRTAEPIAEKDMGHGESTRDDRSTAVEAQSPATPSAGAQRQESVSDRMRRQAEGQARKDSLSNRHTHRKG